MSSYNILTNKNTGERKKKTRYADHRIEKRGNSKLKNG